MAIVAPSIESIRFLHQRITLLYFLKALLKFCTVHEFFQGYFFNSTTYFEFVKSLRLEPILLHFYAFSCSDEIQFSFQTVARSASVSRKLL
ncbi:hypothetical protein CW304_08375 [Bacillus sp. UFRGS-B20]|nr:hypothetical protein CW304_08375 [Bacillus sp. UFRGS-B20]